MLGPPNYSPIPAGSLPAPWGSGNRILRSVPPPPADAPLFEGHIDPSIKTYVYVEIEFKESQEISWVMEDLERPYIGTLQLRDHRAKANSEIRLGAIVRITLPMSLFGKLALMEGKNIKFDTIHAPIPNPTEGQKEDNIIAFVKRAYFETTANLEPEVKKRRWGFG